MSDSIKVDTSLEALTAHISDEDTFREHLAAMPATQQRLIHLDLLGAGWSLFELDGALGDADTAQSAQEIGIQKPDLCHRAGFEGIHGRLPRCARPEHMPL